MKNKKISFSVLWILFLICSCGAGAQNNTDTGNNMAENSDKQSYGDNWQQILAEKTPLEKEDLYKLFPKNLGGYPLIRVSDTPGFNGAVGAYCKCDTLLSE